MMWIYKIGLVVVPFLAFLGTSKAAVNGSEHINIWIVAHTHDDVGWLQTVDQYFINEVQWILDTAVQCMADSTNGITLVDRKFTYVEIAYFYRWWNEKPMEIRQRTIDAIKNGNLQFNLAGWCMSDEASTSFFSVIDQMTEGALFLQDGVYTDAYPKVGWHIDPFGHSTATAAMWADIGFDAFGLQRIDFRDKNRRKQNQELEFIWRGSSSLGEDSEIFSHVLGGGYGTPGECAFDRGLTIQTDSTLPTFQVNYEDIANKFVSMARSQNQWYRHDHVLLPFGTDFDHQNAYKSFQQMDKLIAYVNSNKTFNATVRYGTFSEYVEAINALNITWPVYEGDFFPYASGYQRYWTGYYTSRPKLKGYVRSRAAVMRATEMIYYTVNKLMPGTLDSKTAMQQLGTMRRAMGVVQHHDAVSGTEKQAVANDYTLQLDHGTATCDELATTALGKMISNGHPAPTLTTNVSSVLTLNSSNQVALLLYNSLAWSRQAVVTVPVNQSNVQVVDSKGEAVIQQIVPVANFSSDHGLSMYQLMFFADLPPVGFNTYFMKVTSEEMLVVKPTLVTDDADIILENSFHKVVISSSTGRMSSITDKQGNLSSNIEQNFFQYQSAAGNNEAASGAYVFRPQQINRFSVGQSKSSLMRLSYKFYRPKQPAASASVKWPGILATAHHGQGVMVPDTFSLSTAGSNENQTTFQLWRVDGKNWGQQLSVDFLVLRDDSGPLAGVDGHKEFGSDEVGSSTTRCMTATVKFAQAFSANPYILANAHDPDSPSNDSHRAQSFVVTCSGVTTSSATFNVCRADSEQGWENEVYIDWLAWDKSSNLPSNMCHGQTSVWSGPAGKSFIQQQNFSLENFSIFEASILVTVMDSSGRAFAATAHNITTEGFGLNLCPMDNHNGTWEKDNVMVTWLMFERQVLVDPVIDGKPTIEVYNGPVAQQVRQFFRNSYASTTTLYQSKSQDHQFVDMKLDIGPLDRGRELTTRFSTDIVTEENNNVWYTDDNGLEMMKRTYDPTKDERIAGNYYPMVLGVDLRGAGNDKRQFTVLSDRSHGCGSTGGGEFEVMLHRRCIADDGFGVGEVLNEDDHIQPSLWGVFGDQTTSVALKHRLGMMLQNPPRVFVGFGSMQEWTTNFHTSFSGLSKDFPDNVHLLSLKARNNSAGSNNGTYVFRLQQLFAKDDPNPLAEAVTVDPKEYFIEEMTPKVLDEMNLTGNRVKSSIQRLRWRTSEEWQRANKQRLMDERKSARYSDDQGIPLNPRQIRTFLAN